MNLTKNRLIIGLAIIAVAVVLVIILVNGKDNNEHSGAHRFKEVTAERGTFQVVVTANGTVRPIDRVEIKSKASGQIEELPVEEGDFVRQGALIARLDQKDERAAVAQAQADYDIAQAQLKQAQRLFDRRSELFQKQLISEEEQDQIVLGLAVAKGTLVQATTALDRAKERLSESVVRAPIDGVILQKYVEEGQIIASGVSNVSGGSPIADIADMSSVYIEAGIDEIDIGKVQVGQSALVMADAYPGFLFQGKIMRIAPEAKIEQNVTLFDVVVEVENPEGRLKSGMNTNIEITIINKENILLVPTMALQMPEGAEGAGDERTVLLKGEGGFAPHQVKIGLSNFKQAEILSGLQEDDTLGVPMTSRLKEQNEMLEDRIRSSRSFGTSSQSGSRR
ncbi:efflux RND transporter periplasmic adaptor subunit [Candidatus Zixiibacteriota bacterium]